jgi:hypothetical protein
VRIYEFEVREGYEWVVPVNDADFKIFRAFDGTPLAGSWKAVPVRLVKKDEQGRPLLDSDAPWLGKHAPVFRNRAVEALASLLSTGAELLPLECGEAALQVLNVTAVLDALDEARSSVVKFPTTGRIMKIKTHVFRPEVILGAHVFKVSQMLNGSAFVSEEIVRATDKARLSGVGFRQVWEGEPARSSPRT